VTAGANVVPEAVLVAGLLHKLLSSVAGVVVVVVWNERCLTGSLQMHASSF
jgi:hypothetical protein